MAITEIAPPEAHQDPNDQSQENLQTPQANPDMQDTQVVEPQSEGQYVIDSEYSRLPAPEKGPAPEELTQDAKEVTTRFEDKTAERAELQQRLKHLDEVLAAGALHARRILDDENAKDLPDDLQHKLEGMAGQQR